MFGSEKLAVWQKSISFADEVYSATSGFPARDHLALGHRMRRLAVALSSNIAEGSIRTSRKDFPRFVEISVGLVREMMFLSQVAAQQGLLSDEHAALLQFVAEDEMRMLADLRRSFGSDSDG